MKYPYAIQAPLHFKAHKCHTWCLGLSAALWKYSMSSQWCLCLCSLAAIKLMQRDNFSFAWAQLLLLDNMGHVCKISPSTAGNMLRVICWYMHLNLAATRGSIIQSTGVQSWAQQCRMWDSKILVISIWLHSSNHSFLLVAKFHYWCQCHCKWGLSTKWVINR